MGFGFGQGQRAAMHMLAAETDLDDVFGAGGPDFAQTPQELPQKSPLNGQLLRLGVMLTISALFVGLLTQRLAEVDFSATWAAVGLLSPAAWAAALVLTAAAFWAVGQYDVVLHRHFETGVDARAARAAGISAIAVSQTIGLGVVTGAVLRWRMLPDQSFWLASRITVAVALSFLAGWAVVTAVAVIVFDTGGYAGFAWAVLGGAGLVIALWLYGPPAPFRWPNLRTISALTLLCALDTLAAAGALFVLLPVDLGLSLSVLLPAFLLAYGAGLLSGTPGGIGAFELSLLALLPHIPEAPLLAAVLCWRLAYFVLPALLGALAAMRGARWRPITPQPRLLPDMKDCAWASGARAPAEYGLLAQGEHRFLSAGRSGWMVAPRGHVLVGLLDPVFGKSTATSRDKPLEALQNMAQATGRIPALYKVSARTAAHARSSGWRAIRIAREAVIAPATFDLNTPARAALRRKLRRAEAVGVVVGPLCQDLLPIARLAEIAQNWARLHGGERGFSMGRFTASYIQHQRVYAAQVDGVILGFVSFHISPQEWTLDIMRSQSTLPDGAMHAMIAAALRDAAALGVARLSLAAAPETAFAPGRAARALRQMRPVARLFRCDAGHGLRQFKEAFAPNWQARYICARGWPELMVASASIARAVASPRKLVDFPQEDAKIAPMHDNRFALPSAIWHGKTKISSN
jgi:phosphatidylglycerol lysyltransferase